MIARKANAALLSRSRALALSILGPSGPLRYRALSSRLIRSPRTGERLGQHARRLHLVVPGCRVIPSTQISPMRPDLFSYRGEFS